MSDQDRTRVIPVEVAERIAKRKPVTAKHSPHLIAYRSKGGTYLVASTTCCSSRGTTRSSRSARRRTPT
jgi:hypothetical protein